MTSKQKIEKNKSFHDNDSKKSTKKLTKTVPKKGARKNKGPEKIQRRKK